MREREGGGKRRGGEEEEKKKKKKTREESRQLPKNTTMKPTEAKIDSFF